MTLERASKHKRLTTEQEYFHRLDVELIEQMRKRAALEEERLRLAEVSHVKDEAILDALTRVGFNHSNAMLLHLVPLLEVAWIDGSVSRAERNRIVKVARSRGIDEGSAADQQLLTWLDQRPSDEIFRTAVRALRSVLSALPQSPHEASANSLVQTCADVAAASGGLFGLTTPVSAAEQKLIENLAQQLELVHPMARQLVSDR